MVKAGIIDPTKVVRLALQGTASVAALLITTEAMVAERPEKRAAMLGNGGVGDMDFQPPPPSHRFHRTTLRFRR